MSLKDLMSKNQPRSATVRQEDERFIPLPEDIPTESQDLKAMLRNAFKQKKDIQLMKECTAIMAEYPKNTDVYKNAENAFKFFGKQLCSDIDYVLAAYQRLQYGHEYQAGDKFFDHAWVYYDENVRPTQKLRDGAVAEKPVHWVDNLPSALFKDKNLCLNCGNYITDTEARSYQILCFLAKEQLWEKELENCMVNDPDFDLAKAKREMEERNLHKPLSEELEKEEDIVIPKVMDAKLAQTFEQKAEEFSLYMHAKREVVLETVNQALQDSMENFETIDRNGKDEQKLEIEIIEARAEIDTQKRNVGWVKQDTDEYFTCPAFEKFYELKDEMDKEKLRNSINKKTNQISNARRLSTVKDEDLSR